MEDLNHGSKSGRAHKVMLMGRKTCGLNGIVDVLAFDVNEMIMETEQGMLMIKGSELHVTRLSLEKGELTALPILRFLLPQPRQKASLESCSANGNQQ